MRVLIIGAGQLSRMLSLAGGPFNMKISAFDLHTQSVIHPLTQTPVYSSLIEAIKQTDVITAEIENISYEVLNLCEKSGKFLPNMHMIKVGKDRRIEKTLLNKLNINNLNYNIINKKNDLKNAIKQIGFPMVLKTALGGYNGKGQWYLKKADDINATWNMLEKCIRISSENKQSIIAEKLISFERELSLIGARGKDGTSVIYPLTENIHTNGILNLSISINNLELQQQAKKIFISITNKLQYVGVLTIEFFEFNGQLLVNEIAPRVHNSGHWTQQGTETCQFENHLRAVCGMPLGSTKLLRFTSMINILGIDSLPDEILALDTCHIHWYGKKKQPSRKMGHINVSANDIDTMYYKLRILARSLDKNIFSALHKFIEKQSIKQ
ncbi:N5-carboxyaminoimidazole ribonucleotide synthase [Candidatus Photodesmus katoptron]|uniref:N5-carboxyaminoimidazole ribonucleotide synthase n=1 Tax=Candidatus Photodesmus katoptron Akat1 TaxID=1236703 RepID=S3DHL2_9GAMM|nr:5-(carboxyamino)imidazole ribonucleotide synthase [Candidatus Photodesmus katoptron]EPE37175.1 ATP-grasp protein [Candidatus Photodesmus katoptron Akat1]KEY90725.1 N5-carboxyaminoimidazole ribonucleotide synthase [Candidatus Photodesmus katoptron]